MKFVNIILVIFSFLIFITSCDEEDEQLSTVNEISASQGTYIGVVHINWDPVTGASHYNIERKGPDGVWTSAGSVAEPPFDDYGLGLSDNKLTEGTRYTYRITSCSDDADDSEYSDQSGEGWIYEPQTIELQATRQENESIVVSWNDPNLSQISQSNLLACKYIVSRRYEDETSFGDLYTTGDISSVQDLSYTDESVASGTNAYYQIRAWYYYSYKNMDYGTYNEYWIKTYDEVQESGGTVPVNYTVTQLGSIPRVSNGCGFVMLKNINDVIYAATIAHPATGKPLIYKLDGTSWQNISTGYPYGLQQNFSRISICGDATTLWAGGVSDSAYVYSYNSGWSANLAAGNLGLTNKPDNLLFEQLQSTLYALCYHDETLEVYSHAQGNTWNSETVLESSNGVTNCGFKTFNNKLYAYYLVTHTENNSSLKIKHLEGANWQTDFDVAYDNIMDVRVYIDNSGVIYFISDSQDPSSWYGNVYMVTSSSAAQEMVGSSNTWLTFPQDIDYDDMGNPVVIYAKYISQTTGFEMHLAVYEDGEWKDVAGDFTSYTGPADIESNSGLYFVYGDGTDLVDYYPATLKAIKLNH